ncbi:MAG TPA: hypothetical protein VHU83_06685 [Bryobacteraceae bacterium]|jgi:hypothetical protein|nr:hypothetical protein [Bryobacteraceae bacterium]
MAINRIQPAGATGDSELTTDQQFQIQALSMSPGYKTLLDLMEGECQKLETELLRADPAQPELVRALHARAQSARIFFERVQKQVNMIVAELQPSVDPVLSPEELLLRQYV